MSVYLNLVVQTFGREIFETNFVRVQLKPYVFTPIYQYHNIYLKFNKIVVV